MVNLKMILNRKNNLATKENIVYSVSRLLLHRKCNKWNKIMVKNHE